MEESTTQRHERGGGRSLPFPDELDRAMARHFLVEVGSTPKRGYSFLTWVLSTEGPWTEATDESSRVARGLPRLSPRCSPIRAGSEGPPTCRG